MAMIDVEGVRWVREVKGANGVSFRTGRVGRRVVAEWSGLGTLSVCDDGTDPRACALPQVSARDENKWRRGAVRAMLRHLVGHATLHASAVALDGRAVAFLGESGAGKSTLAAALSLNAHAELLADDLTEVDSVGQRFFVNPRDDAHWLLGDSAGAVGHANAPAWKEPVSARRLAAEPSILAAFAVLAFGAAGSEPKLDVLRGEAAFQAVNGAYIRFVVDDRAVHLRDLDAIARLAAAAPVYRLSRPPSFSHLPATTALLEQLVLSDLRGATTGAASARR